MRLKYPGDLENSEPLDVATKTRLKKIKTGNYANFKIMRDQPYWQGPMTDMTDRDDESDQTHRGDLTLQADQGDQTYGW